MNKASVLLLVSAILFGWANAEAAQPAHGMRIRASITGFDGHVLQVQTREGRDLKITVTDKTTINVLIPFRLRDVRKGSFVGITAIQHGPGTPLQAREVHVFPEAQRGTGEGHYDWDLEPGSSMTNGNIDAVVNTNDGKQLKLSYKGGTSDIIVPKDVPIVSFKPGDKSALKTGTPIFCITQQSDDGNLTAVRVLAGKDGLRPPM